MRGITEALGGELDAVGADDALTHARYSGRPALRKASSKCTRSLSRRSG